MELQFSIIIPVYNRPKEIEELLGSLSRLNFSDPFEVIIVEDGSDETSEFIVNSYASKLNIRYFFKENSGAGASRNFGMEKASGNYFIILDSDVMVPSSYLSHVKERLSMNFTEAYGGPDAAHTSFTTLQKAINYSMTSVITTGGIRGHKNALSKFQPRSFNFGISKMAFQATQGFSEMKAGEDIDLTFRLWENNFETQLIEDAYVYHKRRSTIPQFFKQTFAFGSARPVLNRAYPKTAKLTYWFPSLFIMGIDCGLILGLFGYWQVLAFYASYALVLFIDALRLSKNLNVAVLSIVTTLTQFYGYGLGFLYAKFSKE